MLIKFLETIETHRRRLDGLVTVNVSIYESAS